MNRLASNRQDETILLDKKSSISFRLGFYLIVCFGGVVGIEKSDDLESLFGEDLITGKRS